MLQYFTVFKNDSAFWKTQNLSPNANHKNNDIYLEHLDNTKDLSHKPISNENGRFTHFHSSLFPKTKISKKKKGMLIQWLKI